MSSATKPLEHAVSTYTLGPCKLKYQLILLGIMLLEVPIMACRGATSGSLAIMRAQLFASEDANTAVRLPRTRSRGVPAVDPSRLETYPSNKDGNKRAYHSLTHDTTPPGPIAGEGLGLQLLEVEWRRRERRRRQGLS